MKNNWYWLYIQLFIMMSAIMLFSFIPEYLHDFFGDWQCGGYEGNYVHKDGESNYIVTNNKCLYKQQDHNPTWHWGFRHWVFTLFGTVLTILNIIRVIDLFDKKAK